MVLTGGRVTERAVKLGGVSRVLLIEDDPAVREGLELALTRHGHRVRGVESGEQGLDWLRMDLPDVVVLDLMLPGMDGFEVCRRIRAVGSADHHADRPRRRHRRGGRVGGGRRRLRGQAGAAEGARGTHSRGAPAHRPGPGGAGTARGPDHRSGRAGGRQPRRAGQPRPDRAAPAARALRNAGPGAQPPAAAGVGVGAGYFGDSRLVDACVQRLRAKIEDDSAAPVYVQTVRGFGYRFGPV